MTSQITSSMPGHQTLPAIQNFEKLDPAVKQAFENLKTNNEQLQSEIQRLKNQLSNIETETQRTNRDRKVATATIWACSSVGMATGVIPPFIGGSMMIISFISYYFAQSTSPSIPPAV